MKIGDIISLTPAGRALAQTVAEKGGIIGEQVLAVASEIEKRKKKYKSAQLQLAAEADREIDEVVTKLNDLMKQKDEINDQLFFELRETHEQLKNVEFSVDFIEGTAQVTSIKRYVEIHDIENINLPPEINALMAQLFANISRKKEK